MVITQGAVFWVDLRLPRGSEPGYLRPGVVIQNDLFNRRSLDTTIVCLLTSNVGLAELPGNVLLHKGEANLPKRSVVNATQIFTVNRFDLIEKIGELSKARMVEVLNGILTVIKPSLI